MTAAAPAAPPPPPPPPATSRPVTYHRLTPLARATIQDYGWTVADYIRQWCPDGQWHGDRCGCPDDRCRDGYHHDIGEDCGCLIAFLTPTE